MPEEFISMRPENYFYLKDGRALRNTEELLKALSTMKEEIFKFHVTEQKNDFANWIKDVLKKQELAARVSKIKTKDHMINTIRKEVIKEKTIRLLNLPSKYFKEKFGKKALGGEAGSAKHTSHHGQKDVTASDIAKKLDRVLEKEAKIEEEELLLKRKLEVQRRIADHHFINGMAVGIVISVAAFFLYYLLK